MKVNDKEIKIDTPDKVRPILVEEVKETIREMKNGKAAGPETFPMN